VIEYLSGAVTLGYVIAALFFARFWKRTRDRLFVAFAVAFVLLALNQALAQWLGAADERVGYTYLLRVLGFVLILAAIVDKNVSDRKTGGGR
jgi:peptidoglycan/LPS O-acetylase OafA/YrhL